MTLKISRFLTDAFNKQAKISHFDYKIYVGKPDKIKENIREKIYNQFGDLFLNDANYIAITVIDNYTDTISKKFLDLIENVLDTEVPSSDIKQISLADDEDESKSSNTVLLLKITTK